jgi:hypothetical protein
MATVGIVTRVSNGRKPYVAWLEGNPAGQPLKSLGPYPQVGEAKKAIQNTVGSTQLRWTEVTLPGGVVQFVGDDGS